MATTVETNTTKTTVTTLASSTSSIQAINSNNDPIFVNTAITKVDVNTSVPTTTSVLISALQGPQGSPGSASVDKYYIHNQLVASATWTVLHNLSKKPSVTVVDSAGTVVVGDIVYVDDNTSIATFSAPFGGKAYCN